jgi:hypothetical protein
VSSQPAPLNALRELAQSASLTRLETACRLLAEARSVDEVRSIRDVAEAARVHACEVRLGLEAQNDAAEIKLRAEQRLGELLADAPLHPFAGYREAPSFAIDLGRLCVALSRHRSHATVMIDARTDAVLRLAQAQAARDHLLLVQRQVLTALLALA